MDEGCEELGTVVPESGWDMNPDFIDIITLVLISGIFVMIACIVLILLGFPFHDIESDSAALKACVENTTCNLESFTV